jgi:hypothetical protein
MITYTALSQHLPPGSFEYVGANQLKWNFSQLGGGNSPDDSMLKALAKFLDGLDNLNKAINAQRKIQDPPLPPINFCSKSLVGTPDSPAIQYSIFVEVNTEAFIDNLIDPTQ